MGTLEIRLLGGLELGRDGRVLDQLPLRAARSLFAYLVLNRERAHTRDLLAGTFWPDFDEVEKALDQEEAAGSRAEEGEHLARAVELYRGDLLAGFYDDWLFPDQDRLRVRFLQALERLTEGEVARGDLEG